MEFKDQYKHPKWQQKRIEAFDGVKSLHGYLCCQRCGDSENQLHVHHKRYMKGRMIWEYGLNELEVLCEACHQDAHIEKDELQNILAMLPSEAIPEVISVVKGYCQHVNGLAALRIEENPDMYYSEFCGKIAGLLANKMTMDELFDLRVKIEESEPGEEITFIISNRKGFV